jgi:prepilin-type N-terminal cleavage/methylation domain-containing protein
MREFIRNLLLSHPIYVISTTIKLLKLQSMQLKLYKNKIKGKSQSLEQGFSLIETMIALTTLGVCLAYAMPLFLYARINNSKSEIRTGALIVSQRVFDNIRSQAITATSPPINDGIGHPSAGVNPVFQPVDINAPTTQEQLLTKAMGRQYQTKVTYCEGVDADSTVCTAQYRKFKVEVSYNGSKVYDLEGTYTKFQ